MATVLMPYEPIAQPELEQLAAECGLDWVYRDTTDSTNVDVMRHFERHRRDVVAVAESQRAGRGRRGRKWASPPARNIYCTIGLSKQIDACRQGLISIVTGLALCRAIELTSGVQVGLKWPNDILYQRRKLGGILIESRALGDTRFFVAIGFGINLAMSEAELAALGQPATCLNRIATQPLDRSALLVAAIDAVTTSVREFDPTNAIGLIDEFNAYDAYRGVEIEVTHSQRRIRGLNRGISASGELRLQTEQGLEHYAAAEISLRPVDA